MHKDTEYIKRINSKLFKELVLPSIKKTSKQIKQAKQDYQELLSLNEHATIKRAFERKVIRRKGTSNSSHVT